MYRKCSKRSFLYVVSRFLKGLSFDGSEKPPVVSVVT